MGLTRDVLTTGDVARICKVAPRTVAKWFDRGDLRGYRIPGSKDRRIPKAQLIRFMRANNMPLDEIETGQTRVLLVDPDAAWLRDVRVQFPDDEQYEVLTAGGAFEAGCLVAARRPHVVVLNVDAAGIDPDELGRLSRTSKELDQVRLIAVSERMSDASVERLRQLGFAGWLKKPFSSADLVRSIESSLS
ncbi:MAG: helix-turn-helix domain-containing protein [Phycisphaerales bacterium]|nr:MAG: helix-turn-helix domain-containing protein [Phycisphaerales bacterium]